MKDLRMRAVTHDPQPGSLIRYQLSCAGWFYSSVDSTFAILQIRDWKFCKYNKTSVKRPPLDRQKLLLIVGASQCRVELKLERWTVNMIMVVIAKCS